ncbi:aminoglycoside phosphotransferase family protein [Jiangella asiatica]|uniref:aminoglycoside phosphotransferase family protein n=1 Tax=Jiangella asiatica TaxID=2530372 RepID=UPI0013A5C02D|nr:aminoglycoside phosphotransferase family protein [Jiangella asiatica]
MTAFAVPTKLAEFAARDDQPEVAAWVRTLPALVPELCERWELTVGAPYEPGGQCSWVAPATTRTGDAVVLKVGWRHEEAEHEAAGLRFWDGDGAARLFADETFDSTSAMLMERCEPGTMLARARPPLEQDEVIAGLLRRLWRRPPDGHPFRPLTSMCDFWADEFEEKLAAAAPGRVDPGIARAAMQLMRSLPRESTDQVVLCTDLHTENVLAAEREPWLVVDPKPYVGDRSYDALQHMLNMDRLTKDPNRLLERMADLLDLDRERLRRWLFARCVQESLGWDGFYDVALQVAPRG